MPFVREIIFLGTGTSSCVPNVKCLVGPLKNKCKVCLDAVQTTHSRNKRNNTSILIRISEFETEDDPKQFRNIVIDTGKSFYESTVSWFPKYDITGIDAVLLTHPHADAIFGLDDLRAWSKSRLPVYLDSVTMQTVASCFPYCVNTALATGGGEVPTLDFRVFQENDTLSIFGVDFVPLKVEHGEYSDGSPFYCFGYRFQNVSYISDCSKIPKSTYPKIRNSKIIVLDALRPEPHKSHFSLLESMQTLIELDPHLGIMTGFTHHHSHDELTRMGATFLKTRESGLSHSTTTVSSLLIGDPSVNHKEESPDQKLKKLMPAYDGMRITLPWSLDLDLAA